MPDLIVAGAGMAGLVAAAHAQRSVARRIRESVRRVTFMFRPARV
jgi:flavin-dependent dehydrogenase